MTDYDEIMYNIEVHSVEGIKKYFENGGNPNDVHNGTPLFTLFVEMYFRSPRFKDCVKLFIEYGLEFHDQPLLAVLSDDSEKLQIEINSNKNITDKWYFTFKNAFTPLNGATLLHFCAEYNHLNCARLLVEHGADVNAKAGLDKNGFGGHTPIFHTVAQHDNNSFGMLQFLLDNNANSLLDVKGLIWGESYDWETFIPAVNPISYCMMGLLPQMHRDPKNIAYNISLLLRNAYDINFSLPNIPNKYLA